MGPCSFINLLIFEGSEMLFPAFGGSFNKKNIKIIINTYTCNCTLQNSHGKCAN